MISSIIVTCTLMVLKGAQPAVAQSRKLTLKEAIQLSLQASPELAKSESEKKEAQAQFAKYRGGLFPEISLSASANSEKPSAAMSNNSEDLATNKTYSAYVEATQPLYAGGAMIGGLRLGRAAQEGADRKYYSTRQSVIREVVESFYGLAQAQDSLVAARENFKILESYAKITQRYERIGRAREIDRIQSTVNVSLSAMDIQDAEQKRIESEARLKRLLGMEQEKSIEPDFAIIIQPLAPISVDDALVTAEKNNPDVQAARIRLQEVEAQNQLELSSDLPSLKLVGRTGYRAPDREDFMEDNSDFYSVGLEFSAPLFSGLSSLAKRREHREKYYQAEKDLQILRRDLRRELETTLADAQRLYKQLVDVQDVVKRSRRALELANSGYNRGIVSSQDVVQFQRSRYEAEKLYITIQYNYLRAVLKLRERLGTDLESVYAR